MSTKPLWHSKVFWGVVILVANRYIAIPEDVQQQIPLVLPDAMDNMIDAVGALLTLWGRIKAEKPVTALPWKR